MNERELYEAAARVRKMAYCPYSHYSVGAAVLTESGKVYTGCNIENASYPAGLCAERTAISKAVSEGEQKIVMIAVAGGPEAEDGIYTPPCGICRQVMAEFGGAALKIILRKDGELVRFTLADLLPESFSL